MRGHALRSISHLATALTLGATVACHPARALDRPLEDAAHDVPLATAATTDTAYFAGGCFWGVQAVFQHVSGVVRVTSGYAGGTKVSPDYEEVSSGSTGHAESVRVIYDPAKVSYGTLLKVFFSVAHDPTELDRQGPDVGTQYRSAIFYRTAEQQSVAQDYIAQLTKQKAFPAKIVTEVTAYKAFYPAEAYHQDYATLNPNALYIVYNDAPKIENLRKRFKELWTDTKAAS